VEILPPEMVREIAANFGKHKKAQNS
jgi:hypothetical protein